MTLSKRSSLILPLLYLLVNGFLNISEEVLQPAWHNELAIVNLRKNDRTYSEISVGQYHGFEYNIYAYQKSQLRAAVRACEL